MFYGCSSFSTDLKDWNVSNVTDMCGMFYGCSSFNADIKDWDVSNVTNMTKMVAGCKYFNSLFLPSKITEFNQDYIPSDPEQNNRKIPDWIELELCYI